MDINYEIEELMQKYPTLEYNSEKKELYGDLYISKNDCYEIKIDLIPYPKYFPNVYEVGERIPPKVDRHIYTDSGACCFTTLAKSQILLKTKIKNLSYFIKEIVIPYFKNNSYYEINKKYKLGEYSHGFFGIIEGYIDILNLKNVKLLANIIYNRVKGKKLKIQDACYCGSGVSLKKCSSGLHDRSYRDFKKIDVEVLENDLHKYFLKYLQHSGKVNK